MGWELDEQAWVVFYVGDVLGDDEGRGWDAPSTKPRFEGKRESQLVRHKEVGIEACICSTCVGLDMDPVSKLMACPVEEVQAALTKRGFDLATFDAR